MRNNVITFFVLALIVFLNACNTKRSNSKENESSRKENLYLGQTPPGLVPKIFAPGLVSINDRYEGAISFSPDLKEMYFGASDEEGETRIYYSRLENNQWTSIRKASFGNGRLKKELHPFVSRDSKRIYFTASDSIHSDDKIWYVERLQDSWSIPRALDSPINNDKVFFANQAMNGNLYYFNLSKMKTFWAPNANGKFSEIKEVELEFGHHVFISPAEDYLVLTAQNKEDKTRSDNDIYVCFKKKYGTWTNPISLGKVVNSDFNEKNPSITPDGKYLFFGVAERRGEIGLANLYWVSTDVIQKVKPVDL